MILFQACNRQSDAGIEILNDDDLISAAFSDTFTVHGGTVINQEIQTANGTKVMFGNYVDPEFGRISASSYIQFLTDVNNLNFGDTSLLTLDSIVLVLDMNGIYGKFQDPQVMEIFEITEDFPTDSLPTSQTTLAFDSTKELSGNFRIDFSGRSNFTDLRIPLDLDLGNKLLFGNPDSLDSDLFSTFFKGLYIRTQPVSISSKEPGGIFSIDMFPSENVLEDTRLELHYRSTPIDTSSDSVFSYTFILDKDDSQRFTKVDRNDADSRLLGFGTMDASDPEPEYLFIQAGNLVSSFIHLPYIESLYPTGISRAELVLKVDKDLLGSEDRFSPPVIIAAFLADSSGKERVEGTDFISFAEYDQATGEYRVPITNNVLQTVNGKIDNNGIIFFPIFEGTTVNRAVIGGPGHPDLAPVLRIVTTELPN